MKDLTAAVLRRLQGGVLGGWRENGVSIVSWLMAAEMLCVVPLVFRNAFFDINRIKVYTVYTAAPVMAVLMLLARKLRPCREGEGQEKWHNSACPMAMGAFLCSCLCSYFASGLRTEVLLGNQGRYCGLLFFLGCGAAFYVIAYGRISGKNLHVVVVLCASLVALLGVLNALGIDPLRFYARIRKGQEQLFMSTIGHFDFFGTYLVMMLPLAGSLFLFSGARVLRGIGLFGVLILSLGACAARTDSALIGVHLGCAALLVLSSGSFGRMSRALLMWAICFAALPVVNGLFAFGTLGVSFSGPHAWLCKSGAAWMLALAFFMASIMASALGRRGKPGIGRAKATMAALTMLLILVVGYVSMTAYFTLLRPDADLGAAEGFLRFDDAWGSYRGFVYTRSLETFASYSPLEKLFGRGLDTTRLILEPYADHPVTGIVGVFDDAHCQLLQLLLTGGILGACTFAAFYVVMLITLYRSAQDDPLVCGVLSSVFAYSIVMLINVTQPILIVTYFSLCGLGLSAAGYHAKRRRKQGEPDSAARSAAG